MKAILRKKFAVLYFLVLLSLPLGTYAERLGIAVDENKIAFDIDANTEQTFVIKVTNVSDQEQKIVVDTMDYDVADNNVIALRSDSDWQNGIKEWISVTEKEFTLQPNMGKDVMFYVHVPEEATVGSHRGAVIFRTLPVDDVQVKVQGQIGVHVLINVKGDTQATGKLHSFDVPFFAMRHITHRAEFENTGNIHYVPHGEVLMRNILTNKKTTYDLNEGDHFVLPGKKFTFEITHDIPSAFGIYLAKARFMDGEGVARQRNDLAIGYLFPLAIIVGGGAMIIYVKKIRKKQQST